LLRPKIRQNNLEAPEPLIISGKTAGFVGSSSKARGLSSAKGALFVAL
jgi:hypothetical protein